MYDDRYCKRKERKIIKVRTYVTLTKKQHYFTFVFFLDGELEHSTVLLRIFFPFLSFSLLFPVP